MGFTLFWGHFVWFNFAACASQTAEKASNGRKNAVKRQKRRQTAEMPDLAFFPARVIKLNCLRRYDKGCPPSHPHYSSLKMSLAILARSSLKQFTTILAEVHREHGWNVSGEQLELLMWDKIVAGAPEGKTSKIPSHMLKKLKIQLPYMPELINYVGCGAIKPCGGLYVPCGSKCLEDTHFCATCAKTDAKFGTIQDRGAPGTYTDPQDKREISYGTWLAKQELSIDTVHEMLHSEGFTFRIPEEYLTVNAKRAAPPKRRPGRPGTVKKTVVNDDGTESPAGSSLDGNRVILGESSDEECPCHPDTLAANTLAATVAARKVEAEAVAMTEAMAALEVSKKEKELRAAAKEAAKAVKEAEKEAAKAVKEAAKALAKSEKEKANAEKAKAEKPKPKKEKSASPKPRVKAKAEPPAKTELAAEDSDEDEEIVIDGEEYILRGDNVFDDEGTLRGKKVDGKIEWNR